MAEAAEQVRPRSEVMDAQAPLRELYPREPGKAKSLKRAKTSGSAEAPWRGRVELGEGHDSVVEFVADRSVGGPSDAPNPPDLMCASIAACEHLTIQMVADLLRVELNSLEIEVTGEVDVRGTLMIGDRVPVGFEWIRCDVRLRCAEGTDERRMGTLTDFAERSCVTLATIREGIEVELTVDAAAG